MSPLIKYLLKTPNKQRLNSYQVNGFTMVELLVATVMSFLIITPILAFAVNILNDDVKEQAKASTELELQSAMDYIQQDISQAFYIYDGAGLAAIKSKLQTAPGGEPVLVFWKREIIPNAINSTVNDVTKDKCDDVLDPTGICDDVYAESLVAYYLVKDNNTPSKWCQPGSGNCPARIERWSIRDGAKRINGTYLCGDNGVTGCDDDKYKRLKRSLGFNSYNYDADTNATPEFPLSWDKRTGENYVEVPQVLVNYISPSTLAESSNTQCQLALSLPTVSTDVGYKAESELRIGASDATNFYSFYGCVNSASNIAQITIRGDALRRNEARNADCDPAKKSPYCPSVTGQIGGRSGFGQ